MHKNIQDSILSENLLVIGDVHRKINEYKRILQNHKGCSIQVGDFGLKEEHEWHLQNIDHSNHAVNFGNHDDYTFLSQPHSLSHWSYVHTSKLMTVRGAFSKDKIHGIKDLDWWENEELSYEEMIKAICYYEHNKPKIMITHDCPQSVREELFKIEDKSLTSNGLQAMFEIHQPDIWIFGHHHRSKNEVINGTRFICLSELETMIL